MTSVEERRRIVVVEVAGVKWRESGHVVLHPLPHVASDVVKPEAVGRVHVNRLSITHHITCSDVGSYYLCARGHVFGRKVPEFWGVVHDFIRWPICRGGSLVGFTQY